MMNPLKKKAQEIIRRSKNLHEIVSDPDKLNEIYKHTVVWDGVALAKKGVVPVAGGILEDLYNIRLMGNIYNHRPSADPTKFSVLNQDLGLYSDEYQLGAVLDITNQHQMNFCGRSVGKSTVLTSLPAAHWGAFLPYFEQLRYGTDRPMGIRFILIGDNLNTSKAMLQYIRGYLIQNGLTEDLIDPNNDSKLYLRLINGTEYFVRSCNNVRGLNPFSFKSERFGRIVFGRTIILADEYSRVKRKNILDEELSAYMNFTKGCLFIANTTPWGQDNHAYKQSRDPRFKTRTFPTAANIHMQNRAGLVRLKRMYSATGQEWIWNEEFCGEPSANHGQIFPNSWIDDVTYTEEEMEKYGGLWSDNDIDMMAEGGKFRGHRYYLGGDPNKGKTGVTDHGNPRVTDDASLCVGEETTGSVLHLRWARLYTKNSHAVFSKIYGAEVDSGGYIDQFRWLYRKIPITKGLLDLNPGSGMVGLSRQPRLTRSRI